MEMSLCPLRASAGCWNGGIIMRCTGLLCSLWFKLLVVAMLLVIAGVETNPGPQQKQASQSHYKKTRGSANMSGELYEVKMSALLFLRGLRNQQEFRIASNMDAAGSFDDIVFTLGHETAFIQLKHREKQQSKIYTSQLIQFKGDFSLLKYCKSYLDIKQHWKRDKDLQACGSFEYCLFIVFTNARLVDGVGCNVGSTMMHDVINTEGKCICFKEDVDVDIYRMFESLPRYKQVLAEAIGHEEVTHSAELLEIIQKLHNNNAKQVPGKAELTKLLKDLESLGDLSGYREFLFRLRLCTEQKPEKDLNDLVRTEIINICGTDAVFDKFVLDVQNWWRNTNLYLTEHTNFWQEILISCGANICKQIVDIGVKFSDSECDVVRTRLSSAGRIVHLKTTCVQLSCLKVLHSLGTRLLVDFSMLETRLNEVLAVWRLGTFGNVLVVEDWTDCEHVVRGINHVLDMNSNKTLVAISRTDTGCNDTFSLSQLDPESQDRILDKRVTFQGLPTCLRNLADVDTLLKSVTADIVLQLMSDSEAVTLGHRAADLDPSYIVRSFLRKQCVSRAVFTDEDIRLAVSGLSVDEMQELLPSGENVQEYHENTCVSGSNSRFFIIEGAADFASVCEFSDGIHWIHKQNKHFVWKSSHGNLELIKKYIEDRVLYYSGLEKVLNLPQRLFLLVGEPGVGKSTEMTSLNALLKQTDASMWVVRVDLNDHTQYLNEEEPDPIQLLMSAGRFVNEFDRHLLEYQLNHGGRITLIFDGFDEISPKYSDKVIAILLDFMSRNVKHIWVTSRFLIREDLEEDLQTLAFKFEHFQSSHENEFLLKFWKIPDSKVQSLEHFITKLLQVTRRSLNDKLIKLTGVPLHMKMLAEVFKTQALHYRDTGEIDLPHKLDLLTLYNRFIDVKWEVYYSKINIDVTKVGLAEDYEEIRYMFQEKLMNFALVALLDNEDVKLLHNSDRIISKNLEYLGKFKSGRERTGIVIDVIQDTVIFVHKTFAEYFVALWFSQNFSFNIECFRNLYVKREFQISRNFFDRILAQRRDLHIAVLNQDKDLVRIILSQENCEINERDGGGRTVLHLAVANYLDNHNDKDYDLCYIIRILLDHGADCNVEDKVLCWTSLRLAEEVRAWAAVGLLLERNADTRDLVIIPQNMENDEFVQNVLRVAAVRGYVNLVAFMLKHGVNIEHRIAVGRSNNKATLLHIAAAHKQLRLAKFLVKQKANLEAGDAFMKTPLMWAAECGYVKMAKFLLKSGARIDTRDSVENTAFLYAVLNDKIKMMEVFKQYACDNMVYDIYGKNALYYAAMSGHVEWLECLLGCGIDINCKNIADLTPLMVASMYGKFEFAQSLIMHGAGVNVCKETGETAILFAANYGNFEVVKLLQQHGAGVTVRDDLGNNALHCAASSGSLECVKLLLDCELTANSKNNNDETPLLLAAKKGTVKIVDYLVQQGADMNAQNKSGNTVLHEAANGGNVDCVAYLLKCGLDVDCKNESGLTPLWIAARSGKLKVVNLLVERGADLGVLDMKKNTILHAAASEGQFRVVQWLVKQQGINVTACNSVGDTAVQMAENSLSCCLSSDDENRFSAVVAFLRKAEEEYS